MTSQVEQRWNAAPLHAPPAHTYPPAATASGGTGRDPYFEQRPPSQSYTFDYQRRRDDRYSPSPYRGATPGYGTPVPPYEANVTYDEAGSHRAGAKERESGEPMGRARSSSDSSIQPLKVEPTISNVKGEYPEGWTKEDEEAEKEFLRQGLVNWKKMGSWRYWLRKEWWLYYLVTIVICVVVALMTIYHDQIVKWLTPVAEWMRDLPAGWTIPIVILFVLSFPPLFGHEIVTVLIGAIWGLWIGFGITAAGTFLGEIANFYAFRYCLRSRAEKLEKKNFNYAVLAHVVREGGFFIVFMARLSAIPGHFTTAVFSTCGTGIWIFTIATILTLPKQLIVVYLGVIFAASANGEQSKNDKIISHVSLAVGFVITIWAAWYIWHKMDKAKLVVWRRHRMATAARGVSIDPTTGMNRDAFRDGEIERLEDADMEAQAPMFRPGQAQHYPYGSGGSGSHNERGTYRLSACGATYREADRDAGYHQQIERQAFPEPQPRADQRPDFSAPPAVPVEWDQTAGQYADPYRTGRGGGGVGYGSHASAPNIVDRSRS